MCFLTDIEKKEKRKDIKVCANDTGGRTLITSYDEQGITEIGPNMNEKLIPLFNKIKKIKKYICWKNESNETS